MKFYKNVQVNELRKMFNPYIMKQINKILSNRLLISKHIGYCDYIGIH